MGNDIKYFSLNKREDWDNGFSFGLSTEGDVLTNAFNNKDGYFISCAIDSFESKTLWHRLTLDVERTLDAFVRISYYASDSKTIKVADGTEIDLDDVLKNKNISAKQKYDVFDVLWQKTMDNPKDMLLSGAKGRYIWLKIGLVGYGESVPVLRKLRLYYPAWSLIEYLPEVYQEDKSDFLRNYLSIFQSLYLDLEENIDNISRFFDPDAVDGEFLEWLSTWVKVDDRYIWSSEKLRLLIKNAVNIYRIRGTKQGIEEIVEFYTGSKPFIVEYFNIKEYFSDSQKEELLKSLYGSNPYVFTVIVDDKQIPSEKEYVELTRILERSKPAHTEVRLVVIRPFINLDMHTYLGINTCLSNIPEAVLNGTTFLSGAVLSR